MNNDNLRNLYKTFQKEGYDMPSYEQFEKDMQDDNNLHDAWESLKNDGYEPPEYDTFKTDMWPSQQETVQTPVNDGVNGQNGVSGSTPTVSSMEGNYSQEVIDRYNSPDNKAGNFKDMAQIAAEVEREKQGGLLGGVWNGIKKGGSNLIGNIMGVFKPTAQQVETPQAPQTPSVPLLRGKNGDNGVNGQNVAPVNSKSTTPTVPSREREGGDQLMGRFREFVKSGHNEVGTPLKQMEVELLASGAAETPEDAIKKAYELNWRYADETASGIAKKTVEGIPHGFQDIGVSLDNAYYTREMQDEIKRSADSLGISYDDYVKNHLKPQIGVALRDRFGYSERDADTIARRLFSHEEHATDRVIMDEANELTKGWLGDEVNKMFAIYDAKADEAYQRNYTYNPTGGAANIGSHLFAQREANKESDPDKVLESLKGKAKGIFDSLLSNKEYMAEVSKKAAEEGMTPEAYIEQYVAPGFVDALQKKFQETAVAREMPTSKLEYVLGGFGDSIIGMLTNSYLNSESRQQYINEANALTAMGKNPNIGDPGILAEGSRLATGMAADFWLWGGWGKIGAKATGELVGQRIASVAAQRGVSKEVARRLVEEEAAHHLGKRVAKNIMEHVPQSAITMAGAEGTTEAVRSARDGEGFLTGVGNTISTALHGGITGSAFGLTGGFMGGLTQRLSGAKRLAGKLAGLEVEAATLYTTEELSKMAQGEDAFKSPFKGLVESNIKLGFIKASANPLVTGAKLIDAIKNPVKAVREGMKGNTGTLTDEDVRDLLNTSSGVSLMDALTAMRPERTEKGMEDREGYVSREAAQKGAEAYEEYMTDPDRPFDRKQRVARLLGGIIPPPGLEVKAEVTPEEDGSYVLRTRDIDGQCVREMRFDTQDEVGDAIEQMQYDIDRNQTEALEQKVNLYDAYYFFPDYLNEEYRRAAVKSSSGEGLTSGKRQAIYLYQHRDEIQEIAKKRANGRPLTDEEKQLGEIYEERFNEYAKDNDTAKEFAKKFEEENELPEGALQAAIEGHSFEEAKKLEEEYVANGGTPDLTSGRVGNGTWRTSVETRIVNAYRDALRKRIESYEKNGRDGANGENGETPPSMEGDVIDGGGENPVVASSEHYGRGQEAVKANDEVALREIGHEVNLADARIGRLFTEEEAQKINDVVENGTAEDVAALIQQQTDPAKRDAIQKLHDAVEAMRGVDDGISEGALADEEAIREQMTALQSESGEIIPLELSNGTTVYLKSGNPENRYGTVMVSYPGDDGEVHHAQLNVRDIESVGDAVPTEDFIAQRSQQLQQENEGRYRNWVNGTELRTGNQVELTVGGQTGTFTVDGFFGNGDVQLHDETGGVMRVSQDEAMQMIRATEDKRINEELETERKAYKEAERQRKEAERAEAERQQREVEVRKRHLESLQAPQTPSVPLLRGKNGDDGVNGLNGENVRWSQLGDTGISLSDKEGVEKHLAATYPTEEEARSFIEDQRQALKVHQRDDVQPRIDTLKGLLDDYVSGKREYTDEELSEMLTSLSDLETEQAFLNDQAKALKGIQESLKTPQSPLLSGAAGRMSALSKARSREDKIRIGRELYGSDDMTSGLFDDLDVPRDAYELVSMNLGYGSINWEGLDRGGHHVRGLQEELGVNRGIGRGKDSNGFNAYLAKKGEGKGVEEIVHSIWESPENELPNGEKRFDDSEIRNALLDLLMSASKPTDIRDYVIDQRLNEAEAIMREVEDRESEHEMAEWSKAHHLLPEERESYEAAVLERLKEYSSLGDDKIQEINAIFAEAFENQQDYEQNRRSQEVDRQLVARGTGGEGEGGEGEIRQQGTSEDGLEDHGERRPAGDEIVATGQPVSDRDVSDGDRLETPQAPQTPSVPLFRGKEGSLSPTLPSREGEGVNGFSGRLAKAIEETNTEPTDGQKEAGNYKKGHLSFGGYQFTIESPKGSVRSGKDASGNPWSVTMHNTYGYLTGKGHLGKDGDHLDVFINDDADLDKFGLDGSNGLDGQKIYIIDQVKKDGSFDEHKIMYGFDSEVDAIRNYLLNYSRPWHGLGNITGVDKATFDKWVESSDRKIKPFAETRFGDNRDVAAKVIEGIEKKTPQAPLFRGDDESPTPTLPSREGEGNDGSHVPVLDKSNYKTYMTPEAREHFANDPRFAKYAHPELAFITAAAWDGVVIPVEELMKIPEIVEAEKRINSKKGSLNINESEQRKHIDHLLDAEHGSQVYKDGKKVKNDYSGPVRQERKAMIVIGRPAGGKSSVFADRLSHDYGARIVDSDIVKPWLEGYDEGYGAGYVQEASAKIAEQAIFEAAKQGDNMVIPRIGGKSVIGKTVIPLIEMGYDVQLYYNDVSEQTSIMRAASRFVDEGRYLSLQYLTTIKDKISKTFSNFAEKKLGEYYDEKDSNERPSIRDVRVDGLPVVDGGSIERGAEPSGRGTGEAVSPVVQGGGRNGRNQAEQGDEAIRREQPIFSYVEWKSNDVAFGEKPKEIWNSESGEPLPGKTQKGEPKVEVSVDQGEHIKQAEVSQGKYEITKRFHKKKGTDIDVVNFTERFDREKFLELKKTVKEFGGYYSSYGKGGFVFENGEEAARKFAEAVTGEAEATVIEQPTEPNEEEIQAKQAKADRKTVVEALGKRYVRTDEKGNDATVHVKYIDDDQVEVEITSSNPDIEPTTERVSIEDVARSLRQGDWEEVKPREGGKRFPEDGEEQMKEAINELHDAYRNNDIPARAKAYRKMWELFDARQEDEGFDLQTRRKHWYDYKKIVNQQFITEKNNEQTTEATSGTGEAVVSGRDDVLGIDATGVDGGVRPEGTGAVATGGEPERKPASNRRKPVRNGRKPSEAGQQLSLFGDWGDGTGDASGEIRAESGTRGEDLGGTGEGGSRQDRGRSVAKKEGTGEEVAVKRQQTEPAQNGTETAKNGTETAKNGTEPAKASTEPEKKDLNKRADDGSVKTATEKARPLNTRNYLYPKDASDIDNMSPRERLNANVRALEILRDLMRENRPGTPEEIAEMGRFRGWGGIKDVESFYDVDWLRRMDRRTGEGIYGRLADVIDELDPDGKRGLLDNIRRSALTSYYTPTDIARAINHFLDKAGFKGGDFLDGSYGVGVLEGTMPKGMQQRTQIHGVELDWLTGQLAKHLYPDADIKIMGFQDVDIADNSMDVVGSNIPFGDIEVFDKKWKNNSDPTHKIAQKRIHNYYVVSKIDKTKPGGLLYIMTSNAVMDTPGNKLIREYIADQCEILGAVRLPDNTFKGAGTKVVTDVLFLRKFKDAEDRARTLKTPSVPLFRGKNGDNGLNGSYESDVLKPFLGTADKKVTVKGAFRTDEVTVRFNGYYGEHPEMMLGEVKAGGQYRGDEFGLTSDMSTSELAKQMEKLIDKKIVGDRAGKLLDTHRTERKVIEAVRESYVGDGNYVSNGNLIEQNGRLGMLETQRGEGGEIIRQFVEVPGLKKDAAKIKTMIPLRTALKKLISEEIGGADDATLSALRADLRRAYDQYTRKYGKLHDKGSNYLDNDIDGFTLRSLEKWKDGKFIGLSDIFEKSTIKPKIDASTIKTPSDAVTVSLAEYGEIRESFLRERLGDNWQEQCEGVVFAVPFSNGRYEIRDLYLSGDVKSKLADAERAAAKDPSYQKNVDALKEVQPKDIPFIGIGIHMGARWVPDKVYTEFIWDLLGVDGRYDEDGANRSTGIRYLPEADVFTVSVSPWETSGKANEWHTKHRKAEDLIDCALKNDKTKVQYTVDGQSVFDAKETEQANDKIQQIREKFEEWLPQNRERVEELAKIYNDKFNRTVIPHFDGSHLQVPGLQGMELRPHQKDAVWMLINNRGGIIDHIVGAGKTLVMQCAIMEMRRMGIAKKPMIIALKSTVPQIKKEFLEAFPAARVLAPSEKDFTTKNRKKILSQIALNDWDCVILSHENYGMLPHTEEVETGVIREQLDQLDASIHLLMEQRDQSDMTKRQKKALEKRRQRLENKMSKLLDRKVDREFTFENLGVDYLFVDECQQFKSLPYTTTHQNVAGLASPEGSSRATALLCGARYLQQMHQGDMGLTLLSGTTISNSLVELYSLLQYVRPNKMASLGFNTFDAWASNFAVNSAELEYNHLNELATRSRFRNFDNLPELSKLYTEVADVRNDNNLELPKPKMKVHVVTVPATDALSKITDECIRMCKQKDGSYFGIPNKTASGKDQPWSLLATNISTKAAINVRLVDPSLEDVDGGKIKMVCDNVKALYDKFSPWKGTQMIFCDLGVPGEGKEYDVYNDIIHRLTTEYGIPREEIVDIHVANTDKKKEELFKKMNNGDVRVLIAGAKNGGTGVNVQQRMVGIHHVDMSWNPANITQENGRGARQGNWLAKEQNDNQVEVFYYATENSLDLYKYQLVDQKQKMIDRFKTSTTGDEREFKEEAGEDGDFDAAAVVAMLSGNPIILEKAKQDKKVEKLIRAKRQYDIEYDQRKHQYESDQRTLANFERLVTRNAEDRKVLAENGFVPDKKGVYPATVKVVAEVPQQTGPISKTFEKPGEAGQFIHELMKNNAKVQLEGFGMTADIVFEVGGELFGTKVVLRSPSGIRYDVDLSDSDVAAGTSLRRLLQKVVDNADKYAAAVEQYKHKLEGGDPGEKNWPKQSELDEALAKKKELDEEYKKLQPEEETPQAPLSRGDDGTDVAGEPDVVMEYRRRRRAPKVVSHMEGSLFGEVEREGELFDGKNETPPQPIPEGREKDLNNQIVKMSDGDLLKEISSLTDKDRDSYVEEYDKRHREDYNNAVGTYLEMLENDNTSLDDAYSMYNEVAKLWKDGGYATDERSKLMGQIDALEEYVTQKEAEIMEQEDAEAAMEQQQTESSKQYEEQKNVVREHGYDLTKLKIRDLAEGEASHVERRYVENGSFSFTSGEHVESAADIAYIFRQLEDAAVENSFMVLIKDGVPTVIHLAIGAYNGVMAPIEQAFVAYKEIDPDAVVFIHNHPSGKLKASQEDIAIQQKVEALFAGKAMPAIIINTKSGKYAEYSGSLLMESKRPEHVDKEVPVKVFNFSKQVFDKDWNPETALKGLSSSDIAAYVSSHRLGEHKKMSLIVLDQAGHITGNIFLPWTSTTELSKRANALQIATYINQMGGRSAVVYGNCKVDDSHDVQILSKYLKVHNVSLMDVMTIEGSAYERGVMEPDFVYGDIARDPSEEIFVSNAMRAVENIKQEKATPEQWLKMIEKNGGLKAGEDKWLGLSDWLKEVAMKSQQTGRKTLTKQELLDYIRENQIQVEEVEYESGSEVNPINYTRLQFTTSGLENKKEIALTVPTIEPWNKHDEIHFGDAGEGRAVAWVRFGDAKIQRKDPAAQKVHDDAKKEYDDYSYQMYDKYGAAYTLKLNEEEKQESRRLLDKWLEAKDALKKADAPLRVLVIDEIQSKRHQEAREKGYREVLSPYTEDMLSVEKNSDGDWEIGENIGNGGVSNMKYYPSSMTREEAVQDYIKTHDRVKPGVPDAPFEKNWHELAMKRMLRYAAENGYDKVAWTKGDQQAERYNLGNVVRRIDVTPHEDEAGNVNEHGVIVTLTGGTMHEMEVLQDGRIDADSPMFSGKTVTEVFGKGIADKIATATTPTEISGDGLRIGGEGMRGFYDQMLPRFMDKYGKKWGVKTGEVKLYGLDNRFGGLDMHSVDVTPEMKESVMQGQLMFSVRTDEAPKKTGIGYKVFVLKDGKLYPPMVANPGGKDTPTGVWLDADAAPIAGTTKTGRLQVKAGGKGTQGGSGQLAYRPGWHLGEIPYASQFNRINPETGEKELFPKNFVWAEVEYANDVDYQQEAMSYGYNKNGKFQHALAGLPRLPKDGSYRYRTNPNPETDPWIITGAMKVNRILKPSEVDDMVRKVGRNPQPRQEGAITDEQVEQLNRRIALQEGRQQKVEEIATEAVMKVLDGTGVPYHVISQDEAQRVLAMAKNGVSLSKGQKRAAETASLIQKGGSPADISTTDGAKIVKKLESFANKLEKVSNVRKKFIDEVGIALEATQDGSNSWYNTFVTPNGQTVTIRLGNHNAKVSNFDYRGEDDGISIVISKRSNEGIINNGNAHIVEFFYPEIALRKAYGKPLADIVRSIKESLLSGEYKDTTGLAEREEVNISAIQFLSDKQPLMTSKGVVYGFTDGKDVYLTNEGINPETPAHEYGHLWVKAVKAQRPDLWENIKSLMKEDEVSQKIYQKLLGDENYQKIHGDEDELYEEVLTNMSGQKNRERFEQAAKEVLDEAESMDDTMKIAKVIAKIRSALSKLWHWIGKDLFKIKKFRSVDEVTDRMMYDFLTPQAPLFRGDNGVNGSLSPTLPSREGDRANMEFQVGKGKPRQKKGEGMASYFERLRAWERRKLAEEDENDPMPVMPEMEGIEDFDEMARIQKEYKKLYEDWEVRHGLRDIANAELGLYDVATGKTAQTPQAPLSRGDGGDDVLREQEIDARVMQDIGDAVGFDTTPEGARKQVKYAVIDRRKNLESSNAEDAIFVHDLGKRIDEIAKHQGVAPKELREALPHLIEDTYGYDRVHMDDGSIEIVDVRDQMPIKKTAEVKQLLSDIKDWYDEFYHVLEDAGLRDDAGYIAEGYVNHIWDKAKSDPKAWEEYVENYQRTKSPNMKHREIPTYAEGIDVGLVPKFTDITDIMSYYSRSNNEAVANRKLLDDLACINVDETNANGEVTRSLPLLTNVEPSYFDKDAYSKPYEVPGVGNVWVHKAAQRRFASVFGTMRTGDIPDWLTQMARALDITASTMKKIQLSFSGFHAGALTEVAMAQMRPDRAMKALFKYIVLDSIKKKTLPAYAHPEDFKFAAKHLVNLGATADYAAADVNMITEKLHQAVVDFKNEHKNLGTESAAMVTAVLDYMNKGMDKVLWNYIHDGFKIACFKMFAEQIDRRLAKVYGSDGVNGPNGESREEMRERLLDEAGQYVNDSFGGQYWELLNVTPAQLKWMRRALLSPDWLVSTQRHFLANFGFGSLYNEGGFLEYMRYNRDNLKRALGADIPRNEYRRFRSKNAKQCYLLGVCGFFYIMMNAINALYRKKDEADEREKADEIRKSVPNYRSSYELAYPDGMKWYDYTMYGNTIGQQTHLFLGRYKDGSEWYARWGKQFREFPELFMGRHGVEFPAPMIERMMGKSNPVIGYLRDGLGTLDVHGFDIPYQEKETVEKYGKTIGFLSMTAKHFLPFSVPTQAEKEFKTWDLVMPSQKGFTRWKAVDFFKTYINAGDMHGIERTYHAAVMNGLNAEECLDAAISSVKATQRKELADGVTDLQSAFEKFDGATTLSARQQMRKKIIQYLASEDYKAYSRADALEKARSFMEGEDVAKVQKDNDKYVMAATSEDIRDDWKLDALYKKSGEMKKQLHELEDSGKDTRRWVKAFGTWIDVRDILNDYRKEVKSLKKQLGEGKDEKVMKEIRQLRKKTKETIDNLSPPES